MRPITTHATRTVPIPRPMTQPRVAVPEKALSQPYTDCSPESRVGRYGVALAFSKANVQRSRAASRAEFGKGGLWRLETAATDAPSAQATLRTATPDGRAALDQ